MASNVVTIPHITTWWFRRVLGPDLIKCSSISNEDDQGIKKEFSVIATESVIKGKESEHVSNKDHDTACEVIGLYFTPVNLCGDKGNVEEFTSKLLDLYDRVNYCCESKCSDSECCDNKTDEVSVAKSTADQQRNEDKCNDRLLSSKQRVKRRKLEVIHVVLPPGGTVSGAGTNSVLEPGSDGDNTLDEVAFRNDIKGLPWFAIPYRDIHRTVRILIC
jgi:hypothetical protein